MRLFGSLCMAIAMFWASPPAQAQASFTELITYDSNVITKAVEYDTSVHEDPETGEITAIVTQRRGIKLLNDRLIFADTEAEAPRVAAEHCYVQDYLHNLLADELRSLPEEVREKFSAQIIIDEQGHFAYFEPSAQVYECRERGDLCELLDCIEVKLHGLRCFPALIEGKTVPYWIDFNAVNEEVVAN